MGIVGVNPADSCGSEQHGLWAMLIEPATDRRLVAQVNHIATDSQNPAFLLGQSADQRRTDHTTMSGDEYAPSAEGEERQRRHVLNRFPR